MRASNLVSRAAAAALVVAASSLAACATPNDDDASSESEVVSSHDAVSVALLGDVVAARTTRTIDGAARTSVVGLQAKVSAMLSATGVKDGLTEGSPRCFPRNPLVVEYIGANGAVLGQARFACDGLPDGPAPGTLKVGAKSFILSGDVAQIAALEAQPLAVGDSLYGITRVVGEHAGVVKTASTPAKVKAALASVGMGQTPTTPSPIMPACVADNTVTFYRGEQKVATVSAICTLDRRPAAQAKLRVEGGGGGMVKIDAGRMRDALGLD